MEPRVCLEQEVAFRLQETAIANNLSPVSPQSSEIPVYSADLTLEETNYTVSEDR